MKKHTTPLHHVLLVQALLLLPGCGKVIDWVKDTFPQAETTNQFCKDAYEYVKSVIMYDQLTTVAKFDALWVADKIRVIYSDVISLKFGKSDEQKKALLLRQLEENNYYIVFYVLSAYDQPLGDALSAWTIFLSIDGKNYAPREIKAVDLEPEYICMFGEKFNRFKVPYSVKFDAKDFEGSPLITDATQSIKLTFRSVKRELFLTWDILPTIVHNNNELS